MRIAVLNASGVQSRAIADRLSVEHEVTRLSRTEGPNLTLVDSTAEEALTRAFEGHQAAVLTSPIDHGSGVREAYAERVSRAAERAGLTRLILNTAAAVLEDSDRPVAAVLKQVRSIIRSGATPSTVVQPTVYLDNLVAPWALPSVVNDGLIAYPVAPDTRISWVSHADLARFIAAAIASPKAVSQVYDIGGEARTGREVAGAVARAVGRPVAWQSIPLDAFAAGLNAAFGAPAGDDIADLYRHLERHPQALARDRSAWKALELVPETVEAWAGRQRWSVD